jgi:hypothetical protein
MSEYPPAEEKTSRIDGQSFSNSGVPVELMIEGLSNNTYARTY